MRRPLVLAALGFSGGIFIQFYADTALCPALAGTAFFALSFTAAGKKAASFASCFAHRGRGEASRIFYKAACLMLAAFVAGSLLMYLEGGWQGTGAISEEGMQAVLHGVVESVSSDEEGKGCKLVLKTGFREKVLLTYQGGPEQLGFSSFASLTGHWIEAKGALSLPPGRKNPGGFDYKLYLRTKDVFTVMKAEGLAVEGTARPVSNALARAREFFSKRVFQSCGKEAGGLLLGMLFGDKSSMEPELYEAFQKNGIAHLLAVSGIHVNVIYFYVRRILKGRRDWIASTVSLLFLLFYAALAGFSPSVARASLMIAFSIAAVLLKRDYDMCTGIAASALILLGTRPYRLFDPGFQLSFLAAFVLAAILPWAQVKWRKLADRVRQERVAGLLDGAGPMLVLQGAMAPATAYLFQTFSWASFVLNPILIPLAGLAVPLGIAAFPLSFLPGGIGGFCFSFCVNGAALPVRLMILCSTFFADRGWGYASVVSPSMGTVILFYAGLFFFCSESRYILIRRGGRRLTAAAAALILFFSCVFPWAAGAADRPFFLSRLQPAMVFVDVGQGDCLHLRTPDGKNVLIDGGGSRNYNVGKKILAPYLLKNGISHVDLALVTHLHQDHYGGLRELAAIIPVKSVGMYEANRLKEAELWDEWTDVGISDERKPEIVYLKKGDRIELGKEIWIDVLAPQRKSAEEYLRLVEDQEDENAASLIFQVHWKGLRVLVTGDMGMDGEEKLLKDCGKDALSAHILKVGHHGSRYSTSEEFLRAVSPQAAVIQVGKNNFGHPSDRVIELFWNYDIITYRTDRQGAVSVKSVSGEEAVLIDMQEEKIWRINLRRRRSTHIRPFRRT